MAFATRTEALVGSVQLRVQRLLHHGEHTTASPSPRRLGVAPDQPVGVGPEDSGIATTERGVQWPHSEARQVPHRGRSGSPAWTHRARCVRAANGSRD